MKDNIWFHVRQAYTDHRSAAIGNIIVSLLVLFNLYWIGIVYGEGETRQLLDVLVSPVNTLSLAAVSVSATTLGLMLTLLSLMYQAKQQFDENFYRSLMDIAALCAVVLIATVLGLSINSIPIEETKNVNDLWFDLIYYALIVVVAFISGVMVHIIIMLFETVNDLVRTMRTYEDKVKKDADVLSLDNSS